ncbi:tetratricopeptide repeat protein [Rhodocyclus tenuis]|uniref:Tetratricopeptide repeat protein n=2 Tax=Rhodocyclus TaxID=1064 RepID=A0A6L5JW34_RHOTE|nr:tetratricopeptide repeat protein [Rhodocyclus gracilis]
MARDDFRVILQKFRCARLDSTMPAHSGIPAPPSSVAAHQRVWNKTMNPGSAAIDASILTQAVEQFVAGNLLRAEELCSPLAEGTDNEHAIYLLAQIKSRLGRTESALDLMQRLLDIDPMQSRYHNDSGAILAAQGRWAEAEAAYRMATALDSHNDDARFNLALALLRTKRLGEARSELDRLMRDTAPNADFFSLNGELLRAEGRPHEAVEALNAAIAMGVDNSDVYVNLGLAQEDLSLYDAAFDNFTRAGSIDPGDAAACFYLGNLHRGQGRLDEAAECYRKALLLRPDFSEVHNNLGLVLQAKDESEMADACFKQALALDPGLDAAHNNLGSSLLRQGWMERAIESFQQALEVNPASAESWNNLGNVYFRLRRLGEAEHAYRRSLALKPGYIEADLNLGLLLLLRGEFPEGWQRYENRWEMPGVCEHRPRFPEPEWTGDALGERTLLVYREQGMGDNLQFIRYLPLLRALHPQAKIYFWTLAPLHALFAENARAWGVEILPENLPNGVPPIDVQVALLTLPRLLKTDLASIPAGVPYLHAPAPQALAWRERLAGLPGLKVGIVWASGEIYAFHRFRTVHLRQFLPLLSIEGVSWVSLQKGKASTQIAEEGLTGRIFDPMGEVDDFAGTAAIIESLDLVISVDTSVPHLAGALGKPVWLVDRFDTDWRWLLERSDSPWYPGMRIFRQKTFGEWAPVFQEVAASLTGVVASGGEMPRVEPPSAPPAVSPQWALASESAPAMGVAMPMPAPPVAPVSAVAAVSDVVAVAAVPAVSTAGMARTVTTPAMAPSSAAGLPSPGLKLNLGCGNRKLEGFVNVDRVAVCAPDQVVDLEKTPWPWANDSVEYIRLIHVLEHLGQTTETFLGIIKEMWRVCRDGARIDIVVPHPRSDEYLGDPTHVRPVTLSMLDLFNLRLNREWAAMRAPNTPLGQILGVDFEVEFFEHALDPEWQARRQAGTLSDTELRAAIRQLNNVVAQTSIVWRVYKRPR